MKVRESLCSPPVAPAARRALASVGAGLCVTAALLAGCQTVNDVGALASEAIKNAQLRTAEARAHAPASLIGSPLDGYFKKHPITNSKKPQTWPRVAVTVERATKGVFDTQGIFGKQTLNADDCVFLSVRVWRSATEGQSHDKLRLCADELYTRLDRVPMYQVKTWARRAFWSDERDTGSVRGTGPVPPATHFPTDAKLQNLWIDDLKNTIFFVGGVLHVMGFDWNDVSDKRVWFVSVPAGV